jgi:hypothetical protein
VGGGNGLRDGRRRGRAVDAMKDHLLACATRSRGLRLCMGCCAQAGDVPDVPKELF